MLDEAQKTGPLGVDKTLLDAAYLLHGCCIEGSDAAGARPTVTLGHVERLIHKGKRSLDRDPRHTTGDRKVCISDRHGAADRASVMDDRLRGDHLHQSLGEHAAGHRGCRDDCDQEFLSTPAHQDVAAAQHRLQALPDSHQYRVAGGMSELIVDRLEVVDIQQEQRPRKFGIAGLRSGDVLEMAPVVQAGEGVSHAEVHC